MYYHTIGLSSAVSCVDCKMLAKPFIDKITEIRGNISCSISCIEVIHPYTNVDVLSQFASVPLLEVREIVQPSSGPHDILPASLFEIFYFITLHRAVF